MSLENKQSSYTLKKITRVLNVTEYSVTGRRSGKKQGRVWDRNSWEKRSSSCGIIDMNVDLTVVLFCSQVVDLICERG